MATITLRDAQRSFSEVMRRVQAGEEVQVTRRGELIARIVPASAPATGWPDFGARMAALFPEGRPAGPSISDQIVADRDDS